MWNWFCQSIFPSIGVSIVLSYVLVSSLFEKNVKMKWEDNKLVSLKLYKLSTNLI